MNNKLWYTQPAGQWEEALPLGNGSLGAMVYGGDIRETISLNKDTLWSGVPRDLTQMKNYFKEGRNHLEEIREAIKKEDYGQGRDLIEQYILGNWGESYLPLCNLYISMEEGNITHYRRELDLQRGIVRIEFQHDGAWVQREIYCSYPAGALVIRQNSARKMAVSVGISSELRNKVTEDKSALMMEGICPSHIEPDYMEDAHEPINYRQEGIRFQVKVSVKTEQGKVNYKDAKLNIVDSNDFVIFLTEGDSFVNYKSALVGDYKGICNRQMEKVRKSSYEKLTQEHFADVETYYQRAEFQLEEGINSNLPTDKRLEAYIQSPEKDLDLLTLIFHYGRYLAIAGSREGSQPMNLQGIWNRNLRAVWSSNYTVNINTQMNYWPMLACNLEEMQEPLVRFVKEVAESGKQTADQLYACRGWVSHHNIDLWRMTTPAGGPWKRKGFSAVRHSMWPMSGAWLCRHLFEQYEYTLDKNFLEKTVYDILRGSCEFMLDWMVETSEGVLMTIPSTSPENEFRHLGHVYSAGISSTMDISIVRELFKNFMKTAEILEKKDDTYQKVIEAEKKLPPIAMHKAGGIMEWSKEYEENETNHRHLSHLYALYPGEDMPKDLSEACECTLLRRGDEGTGWSMAWKACLWARLGNANKAYELLKAQLRIVDKLEVQYTNGGIYKNLFMAHPPFQIDANFGITAAMTEMLLQSKNNEVIILPALPEEWKNGYIKGVRAKGGLLLDIIWHDAKLKTIKIKNINKKIKDAQTYRICYHGRKMEFILESEEERTLYPYDFT